MGNTKAPVLREELPRILQAASEVDREWRGERYQTPHGEIGEAVATILILRYTGMHVSVLAEPEDHKLRVQDEDDVRCIAWVRTKKDPIEGHVSIPIASEITFDVAAYIEERKKRSRRKYQSSRQYYHALIKRVGRAAGMPDISPMTFRHTMAVDLLEQGAPEILVMQVLNCSKKVLKTYGKYTKRHKMAFFKRIGW